MNTLADDDSNEAVEVDDSNEAAEVDDSNKAVDVDDEKTEVAKGFGDLSDALEDAAGGLCDQAATMSQDFEDDAAYVQKIDGEIAYFKSFADQYQDMRALSSSTRMPMAPSCRAIFRMRSISC